MAILASSELFIPNWMLIIPFFLQGILIFVDEFYFHWKRGLPKWEQINHPIDSFFVFAILLYCSFLPFSREFFWGFLFLSLSSAFLVTRDEFVHAEKCSALEHWNHSLLFISHCLSLVSIGFLWSLNIIAPLFLYSLVVALFFLYQVLYWPLLKKSEVT